LVVVEAMEGLSLFYCCCQLDDRASGYELLVVVQLKGPEGVQLHSALIAIEMFRLNSQGCVLM